LLKLLAQCCEEGLYGFLIAFKKVPLAYFLAADQASALQSGEVGGNSGLRQPEALVELACAHTVLSAVMLVRELDLRIFKQANDFSAYWVCQRFYYFVEVDRHSGSAHEV